MIHLVVLVFAGLFLVVSSALADIVTFEKEYTYKANEADSKISCRVIALEQVKRQLLEELGTYLESETEVKDFQLSRDKIIVLTAGIVKVDILDEEWDGVTYRMRSQVTADTDQVTRSIDALRQDRQKIKELEETRKRADELLTEVERLKTELELARADTKPQNQKEYAEAVKELSAIDWFDKGYSSRLSGDYDGAIASFTKATVIYPQFAAAYNNRGLTYAETGNYQMAINDYNRVIVINPAYAPVYYNRSVVYFNIGYKRQAAKDYDRAIKIDAGYSTVRYQRPVIRVHDSNYQKTVKNFVNPAPRPPQPPPVQPSHILITNVYRSHGNAYAGTDSKNDVVKDRGSTARPAAVEGARYSARQAAPMEARRYQQQQRPRQVQVAYVSRPERTERDPVIYGGEKKEVYNREPGMLLTSARTGPSGNPMPRRSNMRAPSVKRYTRAH